MNLNTCLAHSGASCRFAQRPREGMDVSHFQGGTLMGSWPLVPCFEWGGLRLPPVSCGKSQRLWREPPDCEHTAGVLLSVRHRLGRFLLFLPSTQKAPISSGALAESSALPQTRACSESLSGLSHVPGTGLGTLHILFDLIVSVLGSVTIFIFWRRKLRRGKTNDLPTVTWLIRGSEGRATLQALHPPLCARRSQPWLPIGITCAALSRPRAVTTSEALGPGPRHQYFSKLSRCWWCAPRVEKSCSSGISRLPDSCSITPQLSQTWDTQNSTLPSFPKFAPLLIASL